VILLDTNVVSAVMAPAPPPTVLQWLDDQETAGLFICTITVAEIGYGIRVLPRGRRQGLLRERFTAFIARGFEQRVLAFDIVAAHEYAEIMGHRRELGRPMSVPDGQIAAIARAHRGIVATRNVRDFEECGLEIVDPFAAVR